MNQRKRASLRRELLRTFIVTALCLGICACGEVDNRKRSLSRKRQAAIARRAKLLDKVKRGWDGNIAGSKKSKRMTVRTR
jgi:hypothetical protein